jgi:ankyrin repeat protein
MWAAADGSVELAKALIDAHADVHASDTKGFTPLLYAARAGNIEMARLLLASGVKVDETGSDGTHALPMAILENHTDFALFLLDQGADANGNLDGVRALHIASGPVTLWLGEYERRQGHGRNFSSSPNGGRAVRLSTADRVKLIKALIAHGADVNARTTSWGMFMNYIGYPKKGAFEAFSCGTGDVIGATPLWVAANTANGNASIGASVAGPDAKGDVVRTLLEAGADYRLTTSDGTTPLMVAAGLGKATYIPGLQRGTRSMSAEAAVKLLVEAGADVNAVNEADFTALHGAAYRGLDEVIEYLVQHGAKIDARDYKGRTPYRLAEGSKQSFQFQSYPETAEFLKKLGANSRLGVPGTVQERVRDVPAIKAGAE